ncbi:MAG: hypothetical protein DRJ60_07080 [Thermoprotei archaeon]|nr:MAG: hypothetical protein DRJ60_07080 [Thermoprotei archaeon]
MSWYISPDEIISGIRKRYPTEKLIGPPQRPIAPRVTYANENLYGVMIYIYGEGIKGQYLRHGYFDREGKRYWAIEYGWVTLYGRMYDGKILPLVVLGVPTRFVFQHKPAEFVGFTLEEVPLGYLECLERQMINVDRVMRGEDPVLIIDKYDLLRGDGAPVPSEFIDRMIEQHKLIATLQNTLWEYEKAIKDYKTTIAMLQARVAKLQELTNSYESRLIKLGTEVTGVQQELIRLREEVLVRGAEAESLEEARRKLRDIMDDLTEIVEDIAGWVSTLKRTVEMKKKEVESR